MPTKITLPSQKKNTFPTVFVIFGITGDLMRSKLLPSLYNLYCKNLLPPLFHVVGFARRDWTDAKLREYLHGIMVKESYASEERYEEFVKRFFYIQGRFEVRKTYTRLARYVGRVDNEWKTCANKLFYLAVPPQYYRSILLHLEDSGLTIPCSPEEGWTRVILEKPFGKDAQNAQELDELLGKLFKEEQIYRVDHYLGKETVRNILAFRFSNSFLAPAWNKDYIEKVEIKLLEEKGVGTRGEFYDGVGALRDVGQNHLLQLLALIAMENPRDFAPQHIREKRAEILSRLELIQESRVVQQTVRGQHAGYRKEPGVNSRSNSETFFKIKAHINDSRWTDVPFYLESGKFLDQTLVEVRITFRHHYPCLCSSEDGQCYRNVLVYGIQPHEKITTSFLVKKPGFANALHEKMFEFDYHEAFTKEEFIPAYDKLLLDIVKGDQTLFVSTTEIMHQWHFVEAIIKQWKKGHPPMCIYEKGVKPECEILDDREAKFKREIGIIGLGKMGYGIAMQLLDKKWRVVAYNRSAEKVREFSKKGGVGARSVKELIGKLKGPRVVWSMLPAGKATEDILLGKEGLIHHLKKGDTVIEAGNAFYKDSLRRVRIFQKKGIHFVDVGVSGGPFGARNGVCLMVGGDEKLYHQLTPLYRDVSVAGGYAHFDGVGAGHFVKMVHNGIEYGMMQAIGEGFAVMKKAPYTLDLQEAARIYNHGSVIESRLVGWLESAFREWGVDLSPISGSVAHTGEGMWTVETARELKVAVEIIEGSLQFRITSEKHPNYTGKVVSALRGQFGGHAVKVQNETLNTKH